MNIRLKADYYSYDIIFETDTTTVVESIEIRQYQKGKDGKTDYSLPVKRDISTDALEQVHRLLCDMIYYRKEEFNSSQLIELLFEKLPSQVASDLISKLNKTYSVEAE